MRRNQDRQQNTPPSSSSSLYLKPQYLQDRDSGYTEADSDLDSHYPSTIARGVYPFSDDEEPSKQSSWSMTTSAITKPIQSLSSTSFNAHSSMAGSLVNSSSYHMYQADMAIDSVRQLAREHEWKKVLKHKSGVIVYMIQKQVNGDKMAVFKGELVIHGFTPQSVFYVIGMRKLWDEQFEDGNLVENLNETTSITYETYRSNGTSRAYDLTLVEKIDCSNDGVIIFACTSVDTDKVPKASGKTRNEIKLHGWILKLLPTTPPSTHVTFITEEYIRGWIPGLTKKSLARKPLVIASIDNYLQNKAQGKKATNQEQQPKPTNKLLSPLSAYTKRRPSIMTSQTSVTPTRSLSVNSSILTNPPPRCSSLNPPQTTSRSSSLTKRITFADDVIIPPSTMEEKSIPATSSDDNNHISNLKLSSLETGKLYPPARHRSIRKESINNYKRLFSSDMDEWKNIGEREGVKLYSKASQGYALPILRGDGWLEGSWTTEQLCSVVQCFGARTKWDDYFQDGHVVERFSQKEYLVYTQMRSIFPIHSRDFSVLTQIESDARSGVIHVISASVSDSLTPETDAHIRGQILIHGWTFQTTKNEQGKRTGVNITFISHMDLAGVTPLPSAIIRLLTTEVPLCVLRVQSYITTFGCPPYIRRVAGKIVNEYYDTDTKEYKVSYIAKHHPSRQHLHNKQAWCTDIRTHSSVYGKSITVSTQPQQDVKVVLQPDNAGVRIYTEKDTLDGTIIEVIITPSSAKDGDTKSSANEIDNTLSSTVRTKTEATDILTSPTSSPLISDTVPSSKIPSSSKSSSLTSSLSSSSTALSSSLASTASSSAIMALHEKNQDLYGRLESLVTPSVIHPLKQESDQAFQDTKQNNEQFIPSNIQQPEFSHDFRQKQRNNSIIIIGDQLSFNGPQLSVIFLLMVLCYYIGKLSCRCG
ncbi:uncharacterized protein BX664DRAFT_302065 [Halteromyces radiatus]|uniref:uncharacterized protein n=1 Tax=Halteromyces radiatus TaxID=101107 RepID=UPI002220230D|nr:uncharacterized protein BX664DRAFT_302065 [Halteromyces radiatus]KAI8081384.1 hypothetical protein BX664DRAFT_302065 [Halteromyces radiatus]